MPHIINLNFIIIMNKKLLKSTLAVAMVAVAGYGSYEAYERYAKKWDNASLLLQNVEALTENTTEDALRIQMMQECHKKGGNWDMASVLKDSGFERTECKISGKVTVFGISLEGEYTKGEKYSVPWASYKCESSRNNCCTEQGLYSNGIKLA